jgi:hypothetical protein
MEQKHKTASVVHVNPLVLYKITEKILFFTKRGKTCIPIPLGACSSDDVNSSEKKSDREGAEQCG